MDVLQHITEREVVVELLCATRRAHLPPHGCDALDKCGVMPIAVHDDRTYKAALSVAIVECDAPRKEVTQAYPLHKQRG